MQTEEIYRGVILDHARHPRNRGILEQPDLEASANNPLCGDELVLTLCLDRDKISRCGAQVRGCSICQASASMMSEQLQGRSLQEASRLSKAFQFSFKQKESEIPREMEDLMPLLLLKSHRSRIKCVTLPWVALDDCLASQKADTSNSES